MDLNLSAYDAQKLSESNIPDVGIVPETYELYIKGKDTVFALTNVLVEYLDGEIKNGGEDLFIKLKICDLKHCALFDALEEKYITALSRNSVELFGTKLSMKDVSRRFVNNFNNGVLEVVVSYLDDNELSCSILNAKNEHYILEGLDSFQQCLKGKKMMKSLILPRSLLYSSGTFTPCYELIQTQEILLPGKQKNIDPPKEVPPPQTTQTEEPEELDSSSSSSSSSSSDSDSSSDEEAQNESESSESSSDSE